MMQSKPQKPLILVVLDGVGCAPAGPHNAISEAETPMLDRLFAEYPHTLLEASGLAVGLPAGQMGNSEVGHLNLGAGRLVMQDLVRIDHAISTGAFAQNPVFQEAIAKIRSSGKRAHLMGLCSPGGVHSSEQHLFALVDLLHESGLEVWIHAITDGRDTPPRSAREFLAFVERRIAGKARIGVVVGRYYTMDRDQRWDRVALGFEAHVAGVGTRHETVDEAIAAAYAAGEGDEFIKPRIIANQPGEAPGVIRDGDGVFFFNFRADRAREITSALTEEDFAHFQRSRRPALSSYVCLTEYHEEFDLPVAFAPTSMQNILGAVLSEAGLKQYRCAETEKYAHVTFFFNGGMEQPLPGETRQLVPSPQDVPTYDLKPEMSADTVADAVVAALASHQYQFVLVNFANGDMVGHTGVFEAAVRAVETVDRCVGRIAEAATERGYTAIITADHGNCEQMFDESTQEPHTAHTMNLVPFILVDESRKGALLRCGGALCDVAPTALELLGLFQPLEMTGRSLLHS